MQKDEFIRRWCNASGIRVEDFIYLDLYAVRCECGEKGCDGWQMVTAHGLELLMKRKVKP